MRTYILSIDWNAIGVIVAIGAVVIPLILGAAGKLLFMKEKQTENTIEIQHLKDTLHEHIQDFKEFKKFVYNNLNE